MDLAWKYLVVFGALIARLVSQGGVYSLGVYYDDIKETFNVSNSETVIVFMVAQSLVDLSGILASILSKFFEERVIVTAGALVATIGVAASAFSTSFYSLVFLLGIVNSVGEGMGRCLLPVAIGYAFEHKDRHRAIAVANIGDGIGGLVFPIIFAISIERYAWRGSLLIYAGIVFNMLISGVAVEWRMKKRYLERQLDVVRRDGDDKEAEVYKIDTDKIDHSKEINLFPNLPMLLLNLLFQGIAYSIFFTFIYSDFTLHEIPATTAAAIFGTVGACSIPGRFFVSFMDNKKAPRWLIYAIGHIVRGAIVALIPLVPHANRITYFFLISSAFGLTDGITGALIPITGLDLFGIGRMADIYSYQLFALGIGSMTGLPIAGLLKDIFHTFDVPLLLSSASFACAGLVMLPCLWTKKYYQLINS